MLVTKLRLICELSATAPNRLVAFLLAEFNGSESIDNQDIDTSKTGIGVLVLELELELRGYTPHLVRPLDSAI